ncbi:MAG: ComF family protein [Patescibacteria group bacterium]
MLGGVTQFGKKILAMSRDLLFPVFCISCHAEGEWLCAPCLAKLQSEIKPQFFCHPYLNKVIALADYQNEIIARLIHLLKYEYVEEVGEIFDKLIEKFVAQNGKFFDSQTSAIIPIPLHKKRYLERGFNQAEILAKSWGRHLGVPILKNALIRQRQTKTQVGLSGIERRSNLQGVFVLRQPLVGIDSAILVDDVFTTGSTMGEAATVLRANGVKEVWGTIIARET